VAVIFGDGAAVACLEGVETESNVGVLAHQLHAEGKYAESLMVEAPASRLNPRFTEEMFADGRHFPTMDGKAIFKLAVRRLPEVTVKVLEKAGVALEEVTLFIPHQANLRINQFFAKTMGLSQEKVFNNIQKYGNTTAATIPLALDEAMEEGLVGKPGDVTVFLGLGAGLTWGASVYRFM
jgi:3-oxoacyl-[acyl-carrier-protein] synthase-3